VSDDIPLVPFTHEDLDSVPESRSTIAENLSRVMNIMGPRPLMAAISA